MSSTIDVTVYTLARKFPKLIGKFANGKPVPLGPYTYLQVATLIVGVVTLLTIVGVFDPPKLPALFVGAAIIGLTGTACHDIAVHIDRVDRVSHSDAVAFAKDVEDVAAVALGAIGDEDLFGADVATAGLEVVFGNGFT